MVFPLETATVQYSPRRNKAPQQLRDGIPFSFWLFWWCCAPFAGGMLQYRRVLVVASNYDGDI